MKKFILIIIGFCLSRPCFADVTFFNMSDMYDIDITYRICTGSIRPWNLLGGVSCDKKSVKTISVKNKQNSNENYESINLQFPEWPYSFDTIQIVSVIEKDAEGRE